MSITLKVLQGLRQLVDNSRYLLDLYTVCSGFNCYLNNKTPEHSLCFLINLTYWLMK